MKNVLAILQKELRTYFVSPIAYVVLTVFLIISGYFFYNIVSIFVERSMMTMMQSQQFGGPPPAMDVPSLVTRNFFRRHQYRHPVYAAHDHDGDLC